MVCVADYVAIYRTKSPSMVAMVGTKLNHQSLVTGEL